MAKYNTSTKGATKTINRAGGEGYKTSPELGLVSLLLTSFVKNQFYRSEEEAIQELVDHIENIEDKKFVAKAAIYARDKFGMRSITHALAAELSRHTSGTEWGKNFYESVVNRVDDMTETFAYYIENVASNKNKVKFPNAMKRGFSRAFDKFDEYQLSKYRSSSKSVKLVDVVNIVHPVPTDENKDALKKLVEGRLKNKNTWESELSRAGQEASDSNELQENKAKVWEDLLTSKRMPYFALLRNLRNIMEQAPNVTNLACETLTNEKLIKGSKVLPFRYLTAHNELMKHQNSEARKMLVGISEALNISCNNVPKFEGETLVALDTSGSMQGRPSEIGSLFAAIIAKANMCDVLTFDTEARFESYNPTDSVMGIRDSFNFTGRGTNFHNIFKSLDKKYDRIIILSDMQGWIGRYSPIKAFNEYKKEYDCNPYVYSWDLQGYGELQFPENNTFCLSGFSDKVFDIMELLESDKNALLNEINSIEL